ncbi:hypothetical protein B0H17DRAFT_1200145 [Mycena rosella]|uniref:Uncharacterized protein n=1 Tax=Mycena rosella TaxID=1033263 RepID=A0AAD7DLN8_MYCRO|nr:hypothetical protein B0H17DRAFT_1200145 [Mycena rosella]
MSASPMDDTEDCRNMHTRGVRRAKDAPANIISSRPFASSTSPRKADLSYAARSNPPAPVADGTILLSTVMIIALIVATAAIALCLFHRSQRTMKTHAKHLGGTVSPFALIAVQSDSLPTAQYSSDPGNSGESTLRQPVSRPRSTLTVPDNSDARNSITSTLRRQHLQNELRAVQEKLVDIEDLERHGSVAATQISGLAAATNSTKTATGTGVEHKKHTQ